MSMVSSNGCLAKIIAPITEVNALISSSSRSWNEVWMTVEYKEYDSLNLSAPRSCSLVLRISKRCLGFFFKKFSNSRCPNKHASGSRN